VIIAPFVDKFISPASRKKMVAALCADSDYPQGRFYWQPIVSPLFLSLDGARG
jgi:hypothetical protein